jgi:hypothetical protein
MKENKLQISLVLEAEENYDDIELIKNIKKYINSIDGVKIVGIHSKVMKPKLN